MIVYIFSDYTWKSKFVYHDFLTCIVVTLYVCLKVEYSLKKLIVGSRCPKDAGNVCWLTASTTQRTPRILTLPVWMMRNANFPSYEARVSVNRTITSSPGGSPFCSVLVQETVTEGKVPSRISFIGGWVLFFVLFVSGFPTLSSWNQNMPNRRPLGPRPFFLSFFLSYFLPTDWVAKI